MEALAAYEGGLCRCGFHESLTGDEANGFEPGHRVCPVCAGSDQYQRMLADADERAAKRMGENPPPRTPRPADGRHQFVRMLSAVEFEERRASRGTPPSAPHAPPSPAQRS